MPKGALRLLCIFTTITLCPLFADALEPEEILILANKNAARSVGLAMYYMKKRGIPEKNLLTLQVTDKEVCSRYDYEKKIAQPVRRVLKKLNTDGSIRCLVIMYGLPLKKRSEKHQTTHISFQTLHHQEGI